MERVLGCVMFCGANGLPLRESSSENQGVFRAIVNYTSEFDPTLKSHLEYCKKNAQYLSPDIQNELISECGKFIRASYVERLREAKYFALMADEATDISVKEQISISVRIVEKKDGKFVPIEKFLGYVETGSTTGEMITEKILGALQEWGVNVSNCRAQCYDGGANMSGKNKGVQARIKELAPEAVFLQCYAHSLNRSLFHSCEIPDIRNMFTTIEQLGKFFQYSVKRLDRLKQFESRHVEANLKRKVPTLSSTRWSSRFDCVVTLVEKYPIILETLENLGNTANDKDARSLLLALENFPFIVALLIAREALAVVNPLSISLQNPKLDLIRTTSIVEAAIENLNDLRDEDEFRRLFKECTSFAAAVGIQPSMPRARGTKICI